MAFWDKLPMRARGWIALAGTAFGALGFAFGLGASTKSRVDQINSLPARMKAAEDHILILDTTVASFRSHVARDTLSRRNTIVLDSVRADVYDIKCYLEAQYEGTDVRQCLSLFKHTRRR